MMDQEETAASKRTADLLVENESLRNRLNYSASTAPTGSHTGIFVGAIVGLSVLGIASVVTIFVVRPDKDNTPIVTTILAFLLPLVTALLAAAVHQVSVSVDGRLSQLLAITAKSSMAEGRLAQQASTKIDVAEIRAEVKSDMADLKNLT